MSEQMYDIQNQSGVPKHIYEEGTGVRYSLPASTVLPYPEKIARMFLREHPRYCRIFEPVALPEGRPGEDKIWLANNSGNPFLPKTVFLESMKVGVDPVEIPNPLAIPTTMTFMLRQSQIVEKNSQEGDKVFNQPPLPIEIPPYHRAPYPVSIAGWLMQRDGLAAPPNNGRIIRCRPLGAFEPNMTWGLDDMRLFASMIDEQFFSVQRMKDIFLPEVKYAGDRAKILEAKHELWRHLFFRVIDDQYTPPTREGFARKIEELKSAAQQAQKK